MQDLLAADVVSYSDGGGKARAARRPIVGANEVSHFLTTLRRRLTIRDVRTLPVNGETAATLWFGRQYAVLALDVRDGTIREMQWIMNPDKLRYLRRQLAVGGVAASDDVSGPFSVPNATQNRAAWRGHSYGASTPSTPSTRKRPSSVTVALRTAITARRGQRPVDVRERLAAAVGGLHHNRHFEAIGVDGQDDERLPDISIEERTDAGYLVRERRMDDPTSSRVASRVETR